MTIDGHWSITAATIASDAQNSLFIPRKSSMTKKSIDQIADAGIRATTSGYTRKARPGPYEILVEFIVATERHEGTEADSVAVENLSSGRNPHLGL